MRASQIPHEVMWLVCQFLGLKNTDYWGFWIGLSGMFYYDKTHRAILDDVRKNYPQLINSNNVIRLHFPRRFCLVEYIRKDYTVFLYLGIPYILCNKKLDECDNWKCKMHPSILHLNIQGILCNCSACYKIVNFYTRDYKFTPTCCVAINQIANMLLQWRKNPVLNELQ